MKIKGGYQIIDLSKLILPLSAGTTVLEEILDESTLKEIEKLLSQKELNKPIQILSRWGIEETAGKNVSVFNANVKRSIDSQSVYEDVGPTGNCIEFMSLDYTGKIVIWCIFDRKYEEDGNRYIVMFTSKVGA